LMFLGDFFPIQGLSQRQILSIWLWRSIHLVSEMKTLAVKEEDSAAKVQRLAEEMRFRLKEAMAQRGGSEAFLNWLRSDGVKKA
jgi:hypothetical protein